MTRDEEHAARVRGSARRVRAEAKQLCDLQLPRILSEVKPKEARNAVSVWRRLTAELQQQWEAVYLTRIEAVQWPGSGTDGPGASEEAECSEATAIVDAQCLEHIREFAAHISRMDTALVEALIPTDGSLATQQCAACAHELREYTEKHMRYRELLETEAECAHEIREWETFLKAKYLEDMQLAMHQAKLKYNAADVVAQERASINAVLADVHKAVNDAVQQKLDDFQAQLSERMAKYHSTFATLHRDAKARAQADADVPLLCRYLPAEENVLIAIESIMQEARALQSEIMFHATESAKLACKMHLLKNADIGSRLLPHLGRMNPS